MLSAPTLCRPRIRMHTAGNKPALTGLLHTKRALCTSSTATFICMRLTGLRYYVMAVCAYLCEAQSILTFLAGLLLGPAVGRLPPLRPLGGCCCHLRDRTSAAASCVARRWTGVRHRKRCCCGPASLWSLRDVEIPSKTSPAGGPAVPFLGVVGPRRAASLRLTPRWRGSVRVHALCNPERKGSPANLHQNPLAPSAK